MQQPINVADLGHGLGGALAARATTWLLAATRARTSSASSVLAVGGAGCCGIPRLLGWPGSSLLPGLASGSALVVCRSMAHAGR
jgi:hypothetical protein